MRMKITRLSDRLYRISSARTLALSAAALAVILVLLKAVDTPFGVMRIKKVSGGVRIPDMQGFYEADQAYATLTALGEAGRRAYLNFLVFGDVLLPLAYGSFLIIALGLGIRGMLAGRRHGVLRLNLLPVLAVALDLLENLVLLILLARFPERVDALAAFAGTLTLAKRTVLMTCLWSGAAALAGWGVLAAWHRLRKKSPSSNERETAPGRGPGKGG